MPCNSLSDILIHLFTTKSNKIRHHAGVILANAGLWFYRQAYEMGQEDGGDVNPRN
jgi:hypothetical protein